LIGAVLLLASCWSSPRDDFTDGANEASRDRFVQIMAALNNNDADGLKEVFTEAALTDNATEIDAGVNYLLGLFPDGGITGDPDQVKPVVEQNWIDADHRAILVSSVYFISAAGVDYQLFFADFTTNTIDPRNVGVYALGVGPKTDSLDSDEEELFYDWMTPFDAEPSAPPGIYIPQSPG
jgi:hypothetical protein